VTFDAIIAGGGPAGSSTASYLCMRGRRVLVLERERFPRFHLGESLLPFGNDLHEETGTSFTYYFDTAIEGGRPYAYQVPRAEFDQLLLDNARRLGAEVREEHEVKKVRVLADRVEVDVAHAHGQETVSAPLFVDATGRDTFLAQKGAGRPGEATGAPGGKVADELITTNVACFSHWENARRQEGSDEGNFTLIMFNGGWWWFIPFKGNVTSIGVVFEKEYTLARRGMTPEQLYLGAIAEQREIGRILDGARRIRPVGTTGNWSYRCDRYAGERTVLVGDAAAFIDPLFSTGVLMAMMGGKLAAEAIDEALTAGDFRAERFAGYQKKAVAGADQFKRLVHEFYGENLRKLLLASATNPTMCAVITSMLAGDVYKPRMWHALVKEGFSSLALAQAGDLVDRRARTSRHVGGAAGPGGAGG
jgi:flavin-dependent dehydrogenase